MRDTSRALSALNYLNPSCSRDEWVRMGMAAKSAGLNFEDFHNWSRSAENYSSEKDCRAVWKSFDENGEVTEATLFGAALKDGWQDTSKSTTNISGVENKNNARQKGKSFQNLQNNTANFNAFVIWERCLPAQSSHQYILRKQGNSDGLRYYPSTETPLIINGTNVIDYLVIPCWSGEKLLTLQFISPNTGKQKLNLTGASFSDGYFVVGIIGVLPKLIYVCEGIGQAWAVNKSNGFPAVVCFGSGRMMKVTKLLRAKYPDVRLVIVSDRGKEKEAAKIAATVAGQYVMMPNDKPNNFDANDYAKEFGYGDLAALLRHAEAPEMRFRLLSGTELSNAAPMRWIVHGVIPVSGIAALYGPSGSGKSFLILDMGCAIAGAEKYWFGRRVTQAPVTYVCLEGEAGMSKRVKAWSLYFNRPIPDVLKFITQPFDILSDDVSELANSIIAGGGASGLVIIDTLNRASPGADENSSVDMGNIIAAAKRLQNMIGGLVLLIHHTGKDATRGLRGHSSLYAALDGAIEVVKAETCREWSVAKSKDDVTGDAHHFKLEIVRLGIDNDGEEITSCVIVPDESIDSKIRRTLPPKSGNQKIIWEALQNLFYLTECFGQEGAPAERPCIRLDEAIEKTKGRLVCEQKRQTERAQSAIKGLVTRGLLEHQNGWIWMV